MFENALTIGKNFATNYLTDTRQIFNKNRVD